MQGGEEETLAALVPLSGPGTEVVIGMGRAITGIADVHHSLRDAELAAARAGLDSDRRVMRYRLSRTEQLLGRSLKQPATIAAIYVALASETAMHGATSSPRGA